VQGIPNYGTIDVATDITETKYPDGLIIYPNPSDGIFNIKLNIPGDQKISMQIFDLYGKLIYQEFFPDLPSSDFEFRWNGTDQNDNLSPQGIYLLRIQSGNSEYIRKLILLRN